MSPAGGHVKVSSSPPAGGGSEAVSALVVAGMGCGSCCPAIAAGSDDSGNSWEYRLRKYLLLLAMLVATVTYGAAFNPPGGVWQDADPAHDRIAGDPIIRDINYRRYLAFFYTNATAFALSLVVIVLVLILAVLHERHRTSLAPLRILRGVMVLDLFSLMGAYAAGAFRDRLTAIYSLVLLAGVVLYLAFQMALAWWADRKEDRKEGSAPERLRKVLMVLATFAVSVTYVAGLSAPGGFRDRAEGVHRPGDAVLKGGRHDARLKAFFVFNTTAFVASLLIIIILLDKKLTFSPNVRSGELYVFIALTLIGLVGAYSAGSCRQVDTTIYVHSLIGAVIACILLQAAAIKFCKAAIKNLCSCVSVQQQQTPDPSTGEVSGWLRRIKQCCLGQTTQDPSTGNDDASFQALENAHSLVLLLATLAAAITYQAGLNPPGGLWQADGDGYKAGDPILLTMSPRRYKAFYYCNSVAFVASLVAIVLVRRKTLHRHNALEAAMILDLFGLIGAYAAGSCRDVSTSIYAVALAGGVLVYVVIHVVLFTLDHNDGSTRRSDEASIEKEQKDAEMVKKRRKRLLLFAILAATITYQAGLTPPSGFLAKDDLGTGNHAGDPVLLNNYPRRYTAFFYCNSVSFMLSIALIILLVNPNLYRPAIQSNALSVCTAAGMIGIMGAYAAGSTQHRKTSIYIFALAGFVLSVVILLVVLFLVIDPDKGNKKNKTADDPDKGNKKSKTADEATQDEEGGSSDEATQDQEGGSADEATQEGRAADTGNPMEADPEAQKTDAPKKAESGSDTEDEDEKKLHAKRKYLMLLGILVAGITYQAGLAPPGGVWQTNDGGYEAGDPVMHDNRRHRYLAFFYSNSTSFVASVVVIVLLLPGSLQTPAPASDKGSLQIPGPASEKWWMDSWWLGVMNTTIVLDLLGLLVAYAAGSSRSWKTSGYVSALVIAVLAYFVIHVVLSCFVRISKSKNTHSQGGTSQPNKELQA
ncbi:uncharacterized protein [Miscanthus floridulus]|uniref:uncharacterized protein n=1 Tax=Miscanthus floridulus TaxID=154761 RepID=UPI00345A180B